MLLLDTHVIIWLFQDLSRVPVRVQETIAYASQVGVSFASAWEYETKRAKFPKLGLVPFETMLARSETIRLDMPYPTHALLHDLPNIHADPFDRMLVAHAIHLGCPLVTCDEKISKYPVETLW